MGYASRSGHARTSARNPQAHAICDRCGARYNHVDLQWQMDWAGAAMVNKRILVCRPCLDVPQTQLRSITLSADPMPIQNARPELYAEAEGDFRTISGDDTINYLTGIPVPGNEKRITEDGAFRTLQATGSAQGSKNNEPGTDPNAPGDTDPGLPYGYDSVPTSS